jgi:hypothetical protein
MLKGTIKGGLCVCREATSRKLSHLEMVGNALAAETFPGTGFIGAVTSLKVLFLLAFHSQPSLLPVIWYYTICCLKDNSTFPLTNGPICKKLASLMFKI